MWGEREHLRPGPIPIAVRSTNGNLLTHCPVAVLTSINPTDIIIKIYPVVFTPWVDNAHG
jgi:hypothetical protein